MRIKYLLFVLPLIFGCSKEDPEIQKQEPYAEAVYTFIPNVKSTGSYYNNVNNKTIDLGEFNTKKEFSDFVFVGDEVNLKMKTEEEIRGRFEIILTINNVEVARKNSDGNIQELEINYKVTKSDIEP